MTPDEPTRKAKRKRFLEGLEKFNKEVERGRNPWKRKESAPAYPPERGGIFEEVRSATPPNLGPIQEKKRKLEEERFKKLRGTLR